MKKLLSLILFLLVVICGCSLSKSISSSSVNNISIDTLEILPINVQIKTMDFLKEKDYDFELEKSVKVDIEKLVNKTLDDKYEIVNSDPTFRLDSITYVEFSQIGEMIDEGRSTIGNTKLPLSYVKGKKNLKQRYSLVLFVNSQYCINYPNQQSTLWVDPMIHTYINQYVFLIDNSSNTIVYYKKNKSRSDISTTIVVKQVTMKSLENIYYKRFVVGI